MDILDLRMNIRESSYRSNISSYPLTPPREDQLAHRSEDQLSHRSDSPRATSVIQSVGALRGASSVFMSPHSQLSCISPIPSKLVSPDHPLTPPLQDTESTYCKLMNDSPVLQKSDVPQTFGRRHFYEPSYETLPYLTSPPRNAPYKPTFSPTSDIPRPFKNYAKKYIATLRESEEYLKFKHDMMNRIKSVNSTKSSWLEEGVRSPGSSHDDEEGGEDKSAGQQRPRSPGYWQRRKKNNVAAKKSRDLRRQREDELAIFAAFLDQENEKLRSGNILMLQHCKHLEKCLETTGPPFVPLEFQNNCHRYGYGKAAPYVMSGGFMETHNLTMS